MKKGVITEVEQIGQHGYLVDYFLFSNEKNRLKCPRLL